jgi:hypothetical protein
MAYGMIPGLSKSQMPVISTWARANKARATGEHVRCEELRAFKVRQSRISEVNHSVDMKVAIDKAIRVREIRVALGAL